GKHDAVGRFPDGDFADVTDIKIALASAGGGKSHAADVLVARGGDEAEIFPDFGLQVAFGNAHAGGRSEVDAADFASVRDQRNLVGFDRPVGGVARFAVDAEKFSDQRRGRLTADLDARAAGRS